MTKLIDMKFLALTLTLLAGFAAGHVAAVEKEASGGQIISRDIVIQPGDTLRLIAKREFGKSGLAWHLAEFNNLKESSKLIAGETLRIPLFVPSRPEFATVVFAKGDVLRGGSALAVDDKVFLDDTLETGATGFVSLVFASGSVVNLQPNSTAKLVRLHCLPQDNECLIEVRTDAGEISSDVEAREDQPTDFRITTPFASAAVRGTSLDFGATSNTMAVGVTEGEVNLSAAGEQVALTEGFGSVTKAGEPPSPPTPLLPAPVYRFIPTRAAPGDSVSWWALTAVNNYAAAISRDPTGSEVVGQFASANNDITLNDSIEPGDYYIAVRGIDENGLKGNVTSTKLNIAAIDASLPAIDAAIERDGNEFLVSVVNPFENARGYEIQVSYSEDFSDPLSVDISDKGTAIFRLDDTNTIYARARLLLNPTTVSAYGKVASLE